jgi:GT2 family glycosyltransferase
LYKFLRNLTNGPSGKRKENVPLKRVNTSSYVENLYSDLIDLDWMAKQYKNLILDKHELEDLFRSGIDPNPFFDSDWYLRENKDLSDSDIDPLMHYVTFGENEGRKPNPLFDPFTYLNNYPELFKHTGTLLSHYMNYGIKLGWVAAEIDNTVDFESARNLALDNLQKLQEVFSAQKIAIVIPVYNNWQYTERCIRAIEQTIDYEALQIYIVNDGSTDETLLELQRYPAVKVINLPVNLGYLKACNYAFTQLADYEFLFLLNNDSEPNSGFVVNAMEVMQSNDDAAIVGSTLFSADGKLQAAGGMVGSDGTCLHWGDLDSKKSSKYRYTRKIDYAPFAAVLIRNSCLKEVKGFDERFIPAYYEDVDMAFQMRAHGNSVYVSSESMVIHFGSKSYGAGELDLGTRTNQVNKKKFLEKWRATLESDPFRQSRKPLHPAIQGYDRSILWSDFNIDSEVLSDIALELIRSSMRQGYRMIYQCKNFESANLSLAKFRNNGIQVINDVSEIEETVYRNGTPVHAWKSHTTKLVYEQIKSEIFFEVENANLQGNRIAVLAQWSTSERLSDSTEKLIQELLDCNYEVLLVSACESKERIILSPQVLNRITVLRKPNYGYDFGSWSVGLQACPNIKSAEEVLLINDSMIGPFGSLKQILEDARCSPFDITGLCDSIQIHYHIQSFFFHFKNGSLKENSIWHFWTNVSHLQHKDDVIRQYEIGFTEMAAKAVRLGALYSFNLTEDRFGASTFNAAKAFIRLGNPFIKRELIRNLSNTQNLELRNLVVERFNLDATYVQNVFSSVITHNNNSNQNE